MTAIDTTPINTLETWSMVSLGLTWLLEDQSMMTEFWDIDEATVDAVKALLGRPPDNRRRFAQADHEAMSAEAETRSLD